MRKKEEWMKKGNFCLALGQRATIQKFDENKELGFVYNFWVIIEGTKKAKGPYHPADIEALP